MIRLQNISKNIEEINILKEISFDVEDGKILGLLGPNGAGKTTLMRIITGYYTDYSGDVFINNDNIRNQKFNFKNIIGYLPENNPLYNDMTVEGYLSYIYEIKNQKENKKVITKNILDLCDTCGIKKNFKDKIESLSKGTKQRVGIVSVLIGNPEILILDEPTNGLDPNQIMEIRDLIKSISKNKTIIISTHIMQEVEALCDKVIIIKNGEIVLNDDIKNIGKNINSNEYSLDVRIRNTENIEYIKSILEKNNIEILKIENKKNSIEGIFKDLTK